MLEFERAEKMRMRLSMTDRCARKRRRYPLVHGQRGFVLIEVLVGMAIFGVISVGFLSALVAGYHGVIVAHDQTMAESLTRTTLENVRNAPFPITDYQVTVSRYDVAVHADNITEDYTVVDAPSSLQMITVTVSHHESGRTMLVTREAKAQ
jgi:prepilin-type N-terminal cleavage/methylation domain-containing protein